MTTIGTIELIAKIDTSQYKKGASDIAKANDQIEGSSDKADGAIKKTGNALKGMAMRGLKVATVGALALGTAVTAMTLKGGISRALNIEDAQAKLRGLGHDAGSVSKIMDNALDSVRGTAFGLDAAATTAANAVASGIKPGEQLAQVLKTVANTAALAGRDMDEVGAIFNKVAASNKVQMDVINQLHDAGVPALAALSKELGKTSEETAKMASAGQIDFATFERAMRKSVGNAADEMGKTTRGSIANMGAAFSRLGANIVQDFVPKVRGGVQSITGFIDKNSANITNAIMRAVDSVKAFGRGAVDVGRQVGSYLAPKFIALANTIRSQVFPALRDLYRNVIVPFGPMVAKSLVWALGAAVDAFNAFVRVVSPIAGFMARNSAAVIGLAAAFGTLATAIKIWDMFDKARIAFHMFSLVTIPAGMAKMAALVAMMSPLTVGLGLLAATVGVVTAAWARQTQATNNQISADERARLASERLKGMLEQLDETKRNAHDASRTLERATLAVERAQRNATEAVRQFGPGSLEAREAASDLADRQDDLKRATKEAASTATTHAKTLNGLKFLSYIDNIRVVSNMLNGMGREAALAAEQARTASNIQVPYAPGKQPGAGNKRQTGVPGVNYWSGGFTGRGNKFEPAGVVHKGEFVLPKSAVDQTTGKPKASASTNNMSVTINLSGIMTDSQAGLREVGKKLVRVVNDELRAKGQQPIGGGAL